jgi:hypothetical protein
MRKQANALRSFKLSPEKMACSAAAKPALLCIITFGSIGNFHPGKLIHAR